MHTKNTHTHTPKNTHKSFGKALTASFSELSKRFTRKIVEGRALVLRPGTSPSMVGREAGHIYNDVNLSGSFQTVAHLCVPASDVPSNVNTGTIHGGFLLLTTPLQVHGLSDLRAADVVARQPLEIEGERVHVLHQFCTPYLGGSYVIVIGRMGEGGDDAVEPEEAETKGFFACGF